MLWALVLLSVMAGGFVRETRTEMVLARNAVEGAQARALAEAGIHRAVLALSQEAFEERWRADGRVYDWRFGGGRVRISLRDEAGKIDLNEAPVALLRGLFEVAGVSPEGAAALADAVADFRDGNDLKRLNGAEDRDYRLAGYPHGAKDARFELISELRQVFGMTEAIYERVAGAVTVYSQIDSVEPLVAPRAVLLALPGVEAEEVEAYLIERAEAETEAAYELVTMPSLDRAADYISTGDRGVIYALRAEVPTEGGGRFVREAVVILEEGRNGAFTILRWRQGRQERAAAAPEEPR